MITEKFYMIYNPNGHTPKWRHMSRKEAEAEAKRLCNKEPDQKFYILEAQDVFYKEDIKKQRLQGGSQFEPPF